MHSQCQMAVLDRLQMVPHTQQLHSQTSVFVLGFFHRSTPNSNSRLGTFATWQHIWKINFSLYCSPLLPTVEISIFIWYVGLTGRFTIHLSWTWWKEQIQSEQRSELGLVEMCEYDYSVDLQTQMGWVQICSFTDSSPHNGYAMVSSRCWTIINDGNSATTVILKSAKVHWIALWNWKQKACHVVYVLLATASSQQWLILQELPHRVTLLQRAHILFLLYWHCFITSVLHWDKTVHLRILSHHIARRLKIKKFKG